MTVVEQFNDCINRRDLAGLVELMTADHTFTDAEGNSVAGRDGCRTAWEGFFAAFPDYRNIFEVVRADGDTVVVAGRSVCSEPALAGPVLWSATVRDDRVAAWQVHSDTAENRGALGL
ncbi:nuclear transport factor 2 family protein [Actinoplanes sp. NPDC051633]|uniref:nuclear transport factor 2 family protein n=1 Tax=Actinoplanes sp. NPDC051633 TaxID=3155670 RepID=UPI00342A0776